MRAVLMSGVLSRPVHMMVARRHRTGGDRRERQIGCANDERQSSIDGRQHEAGGNQTAQAHEPQDEQGGPARPFSVAHRVAHPDHVLNS
jgi:hypothetical protein